MPGTVVAVGGTGDGALAGHVGVDGEHAEVFVHSCRGAAVRMGWDVCFVVWCVWVGVIGDPYLQVSIGRRL